MLKLSKRDFLFTLLTGIVGIIAIVCNGVARPILIEDTLVRMNDGLDFTLRLILLCGVLLIAVILTSLKKMLAMRLKRSRIVETENELIHTVQALRNLVDVERNPAEYVSKVIRTGRSVAEGTVTLLLDSVHVLASIVFIGAYYAISSILLFGVTIFAVVIFAFLVMRANVGESARDAMEAKNKLDAFTWSLVLNKETAAYLNHDKLFAAYKSHADNASKATLRMTRRMAPAIVLNQFGPLILTFALLVVGGVLAFNGMIGIPRLLSIVIILPEFLTAVFQISQLMGKREQINGFKKGLRDSIYDLPVEEGNKSVFTKGFKSIKNENEFYKYKKDNTFPKDFRCVRVENITVRHEGKSILDNVSFSFERGKVTVLRGSVGAGKSTLLRIIAFTETAESGDIFIDDVPYKSIGRRNLWENISIVTQEPMDISEIPCVHSEHAMMSSGEVQKAALDRALDKRVPILLLDEPTSAMDDESRLNAYGRIASYAKMNESAVLLITHQDCPIGEGSILINNGESNAMYLHSMNG